MKQPFRIVFTFGNISIKFISYMTFKFSPKEVWLYCVSNLVSTKLRTSSAKFYGICSLYSMTFGLTPSHQYARWVQFKGRQSPRPISTPTQLIKMHLHTDMITDLELHLTKWKLKISLMELSLSLITKLLIVVPRPLDISRMWYRRS